MLPDPAHGQVLVRTVYLSLDATNRIWASDQDQHMPPVELGEVMRGGTLGVVEASAHPDFAAGAVGQIVGQIGRIKGCRLPGWYRHLF